MCDALRRRWGESDGHICRGRRGNVQSDGLRSVSSLVREQLLEALVRLMDSHF